MSRPTAAAAAAATAAGRAGALPRTPRHPRRISGPAAPARQEIAYPRPQRPPARPPLRVVAGGAAIATRVADIALDVSASRLMDRLVRSRMWIGVIAFGLIGIVAMQVSMLKLNAGIGRAVETASTLERSNSSLRAEVSRLSNGDRVQSLAGARGFSMPAPADVTYLRSVDPRAAAVRAARRMRAPDRSIAGPAGSPAEAAPHADNLTPDAVAAAIARNAAAQPEGVAPAATTATSQAATPQSATTQPAASQPTTPTATAAPAAVAAPAATAAATTASPSGGAAPTITPPAP